MWWKGGRGVGVVEKKEGGGCDEKEGGGVGVVERREGGWKEKEEG